jgi:hypothetical protein
LETFEGIFVEKWHPQIYIVKHIFFTIMWERNGRTRGYMRKTSWEDEVTVAGDCIESISSVFNPTQLSQSFS